MIRVTLLLALLMIAAGVSATAQEPDYHYPFDGSVENVTSNPALAGSNGSIAYGADRAGNNNASLYFQGGGGTVYSYPKQMPANKITVCFWYKTAIDGVVLPEEPRRYNILGAIDTTFFAAPWSTSITRSTSTVDEFCLQVAASNGSAYGCFETDASWNHIALVWDNSQAVATLKGYLNGRQVVDLSDLTRNTMLNPDMLVLANEDTLSLIDDLKIYNSILTDEQIATLGEGGGPNSVAEKNMMRTMAFYPNPTADVITLNIPDDAVVNEIEISDQMGRVVRREQASTMISLSTLSNGHYSVYALNNGQIVGVSTVVVLH